MRRWTSFLAILILSAGFAFAQVFGGGPGISANEEAKGAPFSADVVTKTVQVLQDGNRQHRERGGKIYRDSEGRVRNESWLETSRAGTEGLNQNKAVNIFDPVKRANIFFTVGPNADKITHVHPIRHFTVPKLPPPPMNASTETKPASTSTTTAVHTSPALPEPENLGTQVIEGFTVVGTRRTRTIGANKMGNERPITIVEDSWYSDELHETLLYEKDDPLSGHTTTKLTNIQRGEQDSTLFQVPPGYPVKDPE